MPDFLIPRVGGSVAAMADRKIITVLEPEDEFPHEPDEATNYNESMYLNAFDLEQEDGRLVPPGQPGQRGLRGDDGVHLPARRPGGVHLRPPRIETNTEMNAGGLRSTSSSRSST